MDTQLLKYKLGTSLAENILKILWTKPLVKRQIMFISYTGNYSDSPKYIFRELNKRDIDSIAVWAVNKDSIDEPEISKCRKVEFGSFDYLKAICQSSIVITNNFLNTYVSRRKGQYIINTWHGGSPLKTVGMVGGEISKQEQFFFEKHSKKYNIYLSSSEFMTNDVFRKSFGYEGVIFKCGLPRNAPLYRRHESIKKRISEFYKIPIDDENGIILYAPTFRGGTSDAGFIPKDVQFDIDQCLKVMEKRFNKHFSFLFRSHYFNDDIPENCIIATDYPDMQELMIAADVMITDYSSCMGDMCLMNKPVFLYTPDLDEYIMERGFYWDIHSLPFPVSMNPDEFYDSIVRFDETLYDKGISEYLKRLNSYEGPDSDIKFVDYISELIRGAD